MLSIIDLRVGGVIIGSVTKVVSCLYVYKNNCCTITKVI